MEQDMVTLEDLIELMKNQEDDLAPNVKHYLNQLQSSITPEKKQLTAVYTILHYTTVSLETIEDTEKFIRVLAICSNCLSYLSGHSCSGNTISDSGVEKLVYQIIKHAQTRNFLQHLLPHLLGILQTFMFFIRQQSNRNQQVLTYISARIRNLKLLEQRGIFNCQCHQSRCDGISLFRCKLYGSALGFMAGSSMSASKFFCSIKDLTTSTLSIGKECYCHMVGISNAFKTFLPHFMKCIGKDEVKLRELTKAIVGCLATFVNIYGFLSCGKDQCEIEKQFNLIELLYMFRENVKTIGDVMPDISVAEQTLTCQVISKIYNDLLKYLSQSSSLTNWMEILPILHNVSQEQAILQHESTFVDIKLKFFYLYCQIIDVTKSNEVRSIILKFTNEELHRTAVNKYDKAHVEYIFNCVRNICISASSCGNLEEAVPLTKHAFQLSLEIDHKRQASFASLLCKMLCRLQQQDEAMAFMGRALTRSQCDPDMMKTWVTHWLRCKMSLTSGCSTFHVESRTIANDIPTSADKQLVLDSLFCQLELCRNLQQQPPTEEFHVLVNLLELGDHTSSFYCTVVALLSSLLYSWPESFQYKRDAVSLSSMYNLFNKDGSAWEMVCLINFTYYLCKWQGSLRKIWDDKAGYESTCGDSSVIPLLNWFPDVAPPDRSCLITMVNILSEAKHQENVTLKNKPEVMQAFRVLVVLLRLFGEEKLLMTALKALEKLLRADIDKGESDSTIVMNLTMIKCNLSKLMCDLDQISTGLQQAREACSLCEASKMDGSDKLIKMRKQMCIETRTSLVRALVLNGESIEAQNIVREIMDDDFISSQNKKKSHTSSFAAARVDFLISEFSVLASLHKSSPLDGSHSLHSALSFLMTTSSLLELLCPGICQVLKFYEANRIHKNYPTFGKKTKGSNIEMIQQFELVDDLLCCLYRVAYLWLNAGNMRFAMYYISDGISFCRALCLPERELDFQLLMTRHAMMGRNVIRMQEELNVTKDVIKYISGVEKSGKMMRTKLHSQCSFDCNREIDVEVENAINNSSVMEEEEEEDVVSMSTVAMDVNSAVSIGSAVMSSPSLRKSKRISHRHLLIFHHNHECICRLCGNISLIKQQCQLAMLYAEFMELEGTSSEAIGYLENAKNYIMQCSKKSSLDMLINHDDQLSALLTTEIRIHSMLAHIYFNMGDLKSSRMLTNVGLRRLSCYSITMNILQVYAQLHLICGKLMLVPCLPHELDTSAFIDVVIDSLSTNGGSYDQVAMEMNNLNIMQHRSSKDGSQKKKSPTTQYDGTNADNESSNKPLSVVTKSRSNVSLSSATKTPQLKRVTQLQPKSTKKSSKKYEIRGKFQIFDEESIADIKLSSRKNNKTTKKTNLPHPDISSVDPPIHNTSKVGKTRRVIFNFSSDESDSPKTNNNLISNETPGPRTRSSRRVATRSVMAARRDARKKHRSDDGPVYTDEDTEEPRPTKKLTRRAKTKSSHAEGDFSSNLKESEFEEVECVRENTHKELLLKPSIVEHDLVSHDADHMQICDNKSCDDHLNSAFELATASGDFYLSKQSLHALAMHHHQSNNSACAASHALSIGVTLRITTHINMKHTIRSMEKAKKTEAVQTDRVYMEALSDMVDRTHPHHVISSINQSESYMSNICSKLPPDWTVCMLSYVDQGSYNPILITRLRHNEKPLCLQIEGSPLQNAITQLQCILDCNVKGMQSKDKSLWWTQRRNFEKSLDQFIKELDAKVLGLHRGILLGSLLSHKSRNDLSGNVNHLINVINSVTKSNSMHHQLIEIYICVWNDLSVEEKTDLILYILRDVTTKPTNDMIARLAIEFQNYSLSFTKEKRGHVIMILDKGCQLLPWEGTRMMRHHSVSRLPSIDALLWQLDLRMMRSHTRANLHDVAYIINPKGDLIKSINRFSDWFKCIQSWSGTVSRVPRRDEWLSYISDSDALIFIGHGSGSTFMHREVIARKKSRACALLMGCSSGKLDEVGITEPEGIALSFIMSGSPCVLACLWPVTDKDIDRYLAKCLHEWMSPRTYLTDVIRKAEAVCKMPRLNGSACVVYGLPVVSGIPIKDWNETIPQHFKEILFK